MRGSVRAAGAGLALVALAVVGSPARLDAQEAALVRRCALETQGGAAARFCNLVAQAVEVIQPPLGLAASGGNPVPGTASTLGMRLPDIPRFTVAGRVTGVWTDIPEIRDVAGRGDIGVFLPSLNVDAAIGVFRGFSPAATVGGVLSVDALASIGIVPLPGGDGFQDETPFSWALGARLGVLRESFTLPGISLSAMYRRLGDVEFGDPLLLRRDAFFSLDGESIWSLRAAVGKRLFLLGVTAGLGYDHLSSDVRLAVANPDPTGPTEFRLGLDDFENDRTSAFLNVSWTLLVLHVVGELGWQSGADLVPGTLPGNRDFDTGGTFFGSFALRLSI
ncbi:MAG TPA: hypothetical protein VF188_05140 [Longimicrobiales bacterium]